MIREINRDRLLLAMPSSPASADDLPVAQDLLDTLKANAERCVGMAANMIGVCKRIIAFNDNGEYMVMLNPEILKKSGKFKAIEGCLSLDDERETDRYAAIRVSFEDMLLRKRVISYTGFTAQIIQHEVDHLEGILI